MKVGVTGHLQTSSYTNKEGQKVYTTDVVIEGQEFCESKQTSEQPTPSSTVGDGFVKIEDGQLDELPFS